MNVTHLELRDFRNYPSLSLSFASKLNVIEGANGAGKTNLVEAIYYLSLAKSWRTSEPGALIKSGSDSARILARIEERDLTREIEIVLTPTGRRISVNGKPIHRLSELSRLVNVILFSPEDTAIFKGPPAERRNFLDLNLSKQSLDYFSLIGKYNRLLDERNAALKRNKPDRTYLGVVTDQMIEVSEPLARYRRLYIGELNKILSDLASELYGLDRKAALVYRPFVKDGAFKEEAAKAYAKTLESDILHKATSIGTHREDFSLVLDGEDIASYGSQGENRLAAIALKLAPFFLIEDEAKKPIAVLDDVYSELDEAHSRRLSGLIGRIGQTFVTAAQISIDGASYIEVSDHKAIRRT
jgi:DNA replication and repair protein RecF